ASVSQGPLPCDMNRGVPPTARNARTGELTPPGTMAEARSNRAWETGASSGYGRPSAWYEVVTAASILSAAPSCRLERVAHVVRASHQHVRFDRVRTCPTGRSTPWTIGFPRGATGAGH